MNNTFICTHCSTVHPISDRIIFNGQEVCEDCYEQETRICDRCGERIWAEDDCGDEAHTLCEDCEEQYYGHCAECGRLVPIDDLRYLSDDGDDGYCENCYNHHAQESGVREYYYKPIPIFYGDGTRYFGVELEIDGAGESHKNAKLIQSVANEDAQHVYIKHDGSLDEGLEIVTHPMTLAYHMTEMP